MHVLQDVLEICKKVFGPGHDRVACTLKNISVLYSMSRDFQPAVLYLKRALEIRQVSVGECVHVYLCACVHVCIHSCMCMRTCVHVCKCSCLS